MNHFQLAQRRVGSTNSNLPLGELDEPLPTRPTVSWINQVQLPLGELDDPTPTRPTASWISFV